MFLFCSCWARRSVQFHNAEAGSKRSSTARSFKLASASRLILLNYSVDVAKNKLIGRNVAGLHVVDNNITDPAV